MESECENTRRWLLQAERYEDVEKFDNSPEERERFCRERGSYHYHSNVAVMEPEVPPDINEQRRIQHLEETIKIKDDIIKDKEARIHLLEKMLKQLGKL